MENSMPVSPKEVAVFVGASSVVDDIILKIDNVLSSPIEKEYRFGEFSGEVEEDYYYQFKFSLTLTEDEKMDLVDAYRSVGWPVVQTFNNDDGTFVIRLFMNNNSSFFNFL